MALVPAFLNTQNKTETETETQLWQGRKVILQSLKSDISRFNVDCAASSGLYEAAAGAFGDVGAGGDGDVGECPAPSLAPEECAGAVSNCWSPGQRDTGEEGRLGRLGSCNISPLSAP